MITSFVQYLLMAPSYIAVLNVYAVSIRTATQYTCISLIILFPQFSNVQYVILILRLLPALKRHSDVSWGTKGDNKVNTDLGVASGSGKNKNEVDVEVITEERDIDAAYEDAIHVLSNKPPKTDSKPDPQTEQEDYYRSFRTKYVLPCICPPMRLLTFLH